MKKRRLSPRHFKDEMYDNKRAVLSYEQLPLEDYNQKKSSKSKSDKNTISYKRLAIIVMVLVLLIAVVFIVFNRFSCNGCSSYNIKSDRYPVSVKGSVVTNGNFNTYDDGFAYVSDTHYVVCDHSGEEVFNSQVSFNDPILKLNYNGAALVYDLGGNHYNLYNDSEMVYSGQTDTKMYLADITPDMVFATVSESRDYKAKLSVYNKDATPLFGYSFEGYYITAMALNDEGTGAVACGITTENGIEKSVVYIFDFTEEKPLAFHEISNDVVFDCGYLDDDSVCLVGENASYVICDKKFSKLQKNSYSQMTMTSYDINSDAGYLTVSLSRSGDGRNCTLQCISKSGKTEHQITTDYAAYYVDSYKNRIIISDKRNLYLYSQNGKLLSQQDISGDSRQVKLTASDAAVVLGLKDISIYLF